MPRSTFRLSRAIRSVAAKNQWSGPVKTIFTWFHRSVPLVFRNDWSDLKTESDSESRPLEKKKKTERLYKLIDWVIVWRTGHGLRKKDRPLVHGMGRTNSGTFVGDILGEVSALVIFSYIRVNGSTERVRQKTWYGVATVLHCNGSTMSNPNPKPKTNPNPFPQ